MSAFGTKRTSQWHAAMSAFGGKADISVTPQESGGAAAWAGYLKTMPGRAAVHCLDGQSTEPTQDLTTSNYLRGALYGFSAVCICAAFIVVSRLGVRTSLAPWDVVAIRFAVAGVLLLPYSLKKGLALDRLGWTGLVP